MLIAFVLWAQLAAPAAAAGGSGTTTPLLSLPEPGLDDSAAYRGYQTRFFRDGAGNTLQVYLDAREGRVVHLWANAENESIGFTARDAGTGRPASLRWDGDQARVAGGPARRWRTLAYRLTAETPALHLGWFLLGSMRVERDFLYMGRHRAPYADPPFTLPEMERLLAALERLQPAQRRRHLALLGSPDVATLRARLRPTIAVTTTGRSRANGGGVWTARIVQPSLDGRDTIALELRADPRQVEGVRAGDSITLRARPGASRLSFTVTVATTGRPLTPLARGEIFTPQFLEFLAAAKAGGGGGGDAVRARWLERQVRGVELLVSREKLMAGLPTYATYFGRDMLVSALMMRPIWRDEMSEFAVASALRKLSPRGEVSHEEALGGQAVREAAGEYAALVDEHLRAAERGERAAADSLVARAGAVLRDRRRTRENYHMVDDEFQLPVLAARWLADPDVPAARKRAFLLDASDGGGTTRLARLLRELGLVARLTAPYAAAPSTANLISFPARDSGKWSAASWRDSRVGYAGGRYAMDVNAIWVPHALESVGRILDALRSLGLAPDSLGRTLPELAADAPLGRYARDPAALRRAAETWRGADQHFLVRLAPAEVRSRVAARLAAMPAAERDYWARAAAEAGPAQDSLEFLAVALDAEGRPIGVANTDPATRLFLGESETAAAADDERARRDVLRDVRLFTRAYPVGLLVDAVGPVVANDSYAPAAVWQEFDRDRYHGPRVVWGREVNLFLLGVAGRIASAGGRDAPYERELRDAARRIQSAVEASGFRSELWSWEFVNGRPAAVRYGSGSDVQLWSTTDLAVQYALWRMGR